MPVYPRGDVVSVAGGATSSSSSSEGRTPLAVGRVSSSEERTPREMGREFESRTRGVEPWRRLAVALPSAGVAWGVLAPLVLGEGDLEIRRQQFRPSGGIPSCGGSGYIILLKGLQDLPPDISAVRSLRDQQAPDNFQSIQITQKTIQQS